MSRVVVHTIASVDGFIATDTVRPAEELAGDRAVSGVAGQRSAGERFSGPLAEQVPLEDPDEVVRGDRVLHLRSRVRG